MAENIEEAATVVELPRLDDVQVQALEQIALTDRTLEPIADSVVSVTRELRALRQTVEIAVQDAERWKQEHMNACANLAMMHAAAVGDRNGPRAGLIEDIMNLREYAIRTRVALDDCVTLTEVLEGKLDATRKARDDLGAIALSLSNPQDEVERARVRALLKVGNDDEKKTETNLVISG